MERSQSNVKNITQGMGGGGKSSKKHNVVVEHPPNGNILMQHLTENYNVALCLYTKSQMILTKHYSDARHTKKLDIYFHENNWNTIYTYNNIYIVPLDMKGCICTLPYHRGQHASIYYLSIETVEDNVDVAAANTAFWRDVLAHYANIEAGENRFMVTDCNVLNTPCTQNKKNTESHNRKTELNFKWVKITRICLIWDQTFASLKHQFNSQYPDKTDLKRL